MARDNKGFACHVHHNWVSYEIHHIWPQCYHGPDTPDNKIKICPNAHSDIHYLMERMLRGKPSRLEHYSNFVKRYAKLGYQQVTKYAEERAIRAYQDYIDMLYQRQIDHHRRGICKHYSRNGPRCSLERED